MSKNTKLHTKDELEPHLSSQKLYRNYYRICKKFQNLNKYPYLSILFVSIIEGFIMIISANANAKTHMPNVSASDSKNVKTNFTEKISKDEALELRTQITKNANEMMLKSTTIQANVTNPQDDFTKNYEQFQSFLNDIGYAGKPIAELSQDEATALISEDGIFGIKQTSERIANFVIDGSGGDEDRMRAGREGMLQGFKDAEAMWGGELPEISQKTMQAATEMVDKAMQALGYSILNQEV